MPGTTSCIVVEQHSFTVTDIHHPTLYVVGDHGDFSTSGAALAAWCQYDVRPATLLDVQLLGYRNKIFEVDATTIR